MVSIFQGWTHSRPCQDNQIRGSLWTKHGKHLVNTQSNMCSWSSDPKERIQVGVWKLHQTGHIQIIFALFCEMHIANQSAPFLKWLNSHLFPFSEAANRSFMSMTPRIEWDLNMSIKTCDGNSCTCKNLSHVAPRIWHPREVVFPPHVELYRWRVVETILSYQHITGCDV